jgi:hypothetical protein
MPPICEPVLTGERKLFFRPLKRAHDLCSPENPRLKAVGYGSYAGYAAEFNWAVFGPKKGTTWRRPLQFAEN